MIVCSFLFCFAMFPWFLSFFKINKEQMVALLVSFSEMFLWKFGINFSINVQQTQLNCVLRLDFPINWDEDLVSCCFFPLRFESYQKLIKFPQWLWAEESFVDTYFSQLINDIRQVFVPTHHPPTPSLSIAHWWEFPLHHDIVFHQNFLPCVHSKGRVEHTFLGWKTIAKTKRNEILQHINMSHFFVLLCHCLSRCCNCLLFLNSIYIQNPFKILPCPKFSPASSEH